LFFGIISVVLICIGPYWDFIEEVIGLTARICFIYIPHIFEFIFRETKAIIKGKRPIQGALARYTIEVEHKMKQFKHDAWAKLKKEV